jgi:hypothetical protein
LLRLHHNLYKSEKICPGILKAPQTHFVPGFSRLTRISTTFPSNLRWVAHSLNQHSIVVMPDPAYSSSADDEIQIYADANLALSGRLSLPKFPVSGNTFASHGHFVFWNAGGSRIFVVAQADSSAQLLSDYAVDVISPSDVTSCLYSIAPASANVAGSSVSVSTTVTTGATCIWSVTSNVPWISKSGNTVYTGPGPTALSVSQNSSIASRTGTVTVANQTYTITQAGVVGALTVNSTSAQIAIGGGSSYVSVNSNAADYMWTASSNVGWITLTMASGIGGGPIQYQVAANQSTSSRSGMITVADQHFTVVQAGTNNMYGSVTLTPLNVLTSPSGGSGAISVAASAPDFNWFAASNASWITVTGGSSGTGNGQVAYQVQASAVANLRQGTLTIGDKIFTVTQNGSGSVTLNPASVSVGAAGGTATIAVTASAPDFAWTASGNFFVNVNYPNTGTGNGQVTYTVQQNFSTSPRTGTLTIGGQIFTVTQAGAPSALRFVTVTPCRVVDTRLAPGPFGGPSIAGGAQRDFAIPQSACGIPSTAQAYSVNITVVPKAGLGYLTAWPAGQTRPLVSTLNSLDGRIVANAAIVPAGIGGAISTFVTDDSDVILDINGYFAPLSATATLEFYTVTPCRIADTRLAPGPFGGPFLDQGSTRSFPIPSSGCSIPASAAAYSLNITAVPAGPLPYLTTWPAGQAQPLVSTLNALSGAIVASAAIVPAGTSGAIDVFVAGKSDVVIDINGYFAPPGNGGLQFYPLTPCRVMDTRLATSPLGGPSLAGTLMRTVPVTTSNCSVPATSQAFSLNATVVPAASLSYLTLWPNGYLQPLVSTLNALNGGIVANAAIVQAGLSGGGVNVFATDLTDLVLDINGYFAP